MPAQHGKLRNIDRIPDARGPVLCCDTILVPSGLKATDNARECTGSTAICLAVSASQTHALASLNTPVTTRVPSGLNATVSQGSFSRPYKHPGRIAIWAAVAASQMRAVPSFDPVTIRLPSVL